MPAWQYQQAPTDAATILGADNNNNAQATTNVASNADGSVVERLEYLQAGHAVPTADATTNVLMRDVVGIKTDAAVTTVGTTKTLMAYLKGLVGWLTVTTANNTANANVADVVGNKTDTGVQTVTTNVGLMAYVKAILDQLSGATGIATFPSAALPANAVSLAEVIREAYDQQTKSVVKAATTLVNGATQFTIAGGSIEIEQLFLYQITTNDGTASTAQFSSTPTLGSAKTISGASASLASSVAGSALVLNPTALTTAPDLVTAANGGVLLNANLGNKIVIHPGTMTIVVGTGSTTGTWETHLRYRPLARGVTVT